jgi:hypothetical protein
MDIKAWPAIVSGFRDKLSLLDKSGNYKQLLKSLYSSKDLDGFNSYVFEAQFAYDFEINGQSIMYETRQLGKNLSAVDFCRELHADKKLYFELRLVQQRNWITKLITSLIRQEKYYEIVLTGDDERDETIRLQNLILSKCQDKNGNPIKFSPDADSVNVIVVNVSGLHLGMIDQHDCMLTTYGDNAVDPFCRRGIFGLWQQLRRNSTDEDKKLHLKFEHLRKTIHGILFVRYVKNSGYLDRLFIDRELEYFMIFNKNLMPENEGNVIIETLKLRPWIEN